MMNDLSGGEDRLRRRKRGWALALIVLGLGMGAGGAALALADLWVDDTTAGVIAGIGFGLFALGAFIAWLQRAGGPEAINGPGAKRERMHAQRAILLWVLPFVTVLFLYEGTRAVLSIYRGEAGMFDYLRAGVPVLYAWLAASVAMGWDGNSRKNRKYLEDELTQALRARAVVWAFGVLMAGGTAALGVGLWRPEAGVTVLPFALVAAGATAALRFAWLDREAGRDG
jgi:hypothetical protein